MQTKRLNQGSDHSPRSWMGGMALAVAGGMLTALLGLTACQSSAPQDPSSAPGDDAGPYNSTTLNEGDVIQVVFEGDNTMNSEVKVQLDGTINLPLVGAVRAAALTPGQLRTNLMVRYKNLLSVNEITVKVAVASASVYVSGAVLRPARIPLDRPLTALEAIMEAGGFDHRRAKVGSVAVIRKEDGKQTRFKLDLKRALKEGDANPFYLKPYDIIHVPEKTFNF